MSCSIRHRWLKICALLLSVALAIAPVQQAFAASVSTLMDDTVSSHCQGDSATQNTGDRNVAEDFTAMSDIAYGCCCDHCDASCSPDCSQSTAASALLPAASTLVAQAAHSVFASAFQHFSNRSFSPPSPPPLS